MMPLLIVNIVASLCITVLAIKRSSKFAKIIWIGIILCACPCIALLLGGAISVLIRGMDYAFPVLAVGVVAVPLVLLLGTLLAALLSACFGGGSEATDGISAPWLRTYAIVCVIGVGLLAVGVMLMAPPYSE